MFRLIAMTALACCSQGRFATMTATMTLMHLYFGIALLVAPDLTATSFFLDGPVMMFRSVPLTAFIFLASSVLSIYAIMLPDSTSFRKAALLFFPQQMLVAINLLTSFLLQPNSLAYLVVDRAPFLALSLGFFVGATRYLGRYGRGH